MNEEALFHAALERTDPQQRSAYLDEACGDNEQLRQRIEALLRSHEEANSFLCPPTGPAISTDASLPVGCTVRYFGDYEILGEIARGGMGVVYRARQISLDRCVALKMILNDQLVSDNDRKRFHHEAQAAAHLDHPNVVPIYEVGEHEGQPYFAMKLIEGSNLHSYLGRYHNDFQAIAQLVALLSRAVHHAHQRGILHRDLKPGNVLMDQQGQPHLTDFGLAKQLDKTEGLTRSGALVGTLEYLSPEQARAEKTLTTAVDIHGLGAILYVLLAGIPPAQGENLGEILQHIIDREPTPPRHLHAKVPADLQTICLKCLQKDPTRRYGSAEALAEDLERWLHGQPIVARATGSIEHLLKWVRRKPAVATLCVLLPVLLLLGFVGVGMTRLWQIAENEKRRAEVANDKLAASKERVDVLLYAQRLWSAREVLRNHRHLWLKKGLEECSQEQRGWEWHFLKRCCLHERTLKGLNTEGGLQDVHFLPDGQRLISAAGGVVKVWNWKTGAELLTLRTGKESEEGERLAIDRGQRLALLNEQGIHVWDLRARKHLCSIPVKMASLDATKQFGREFPFLFSADNHILKRALLMLWWRKEALERAANLVASPLRGHPWHIARMVLLADGGGAPWIPPSIQAFEIAANAVVSPLQGHPWHTARMILLANGKVAPWTRLPKPEVPPVWVYAIDLNADGTRLISGGTDEAITLWDARTGNRLKTLKGHKDAVTCVAFSSDDRWIVSGSKDCTVKVWDVQTGKERFTLKGHTQYIRHLAMSSDNNKIASYSDLFGVGLPDTQTIKVWDVKTRQQKASITEHMDDVLSVHFGPRGEQLITGHASGDLRLWHADSGQLLCTIHNTFTVTTGAQLSPDGRNLASSSDGDIHIFRVPRPAENWAGQYIQPATRPSTFFTARETLLVCALEEEKWTVEEVFLDSIMNVEEYGPVGGVFVSSPPRRKTILSQKMHIGKGAWCQLNPNGNSIAVYSGGDARSVQVWDVKQARQTFTLKGHAQPVHKLVFSTDGKWIATLAFNKEMGEIKIWNARTGQCTHTFSEGVSPDTRLAFRPHTHQLVWSNKENEITLHDTESGERVSTLQGAGPVTCLALSRDGKQLVAGSPKNQSPGDPLERGRLMHWNLVTGTQRWKVDCDDVPECLTFTPDGRRVVVADRRGLVLFWDAKVGEWLISPQAIFLYEVPGGKTGKPLSLSFTEDGDTLMLSSTTYDRLHVSVWSVR